METRLLWKTTGLLAVCTGLLILAGTKTAVRAQAPADSQALVAFFTAYDAAFTAKDLERLATMYHPDVTVYEGGGINPGWADYRDRHLGPELKSFGNLQFRHINVVARPIGPDAAYVTAEYLLDAVTDTREIRSGGLATYVMIRESGQWKIRHSHTSSRRRTS